MLGLIEVPEAFLDLRRRGLIWFTRGFVSFRFPNTVKLACGGIEGLEVALEL